MALISEGSVSIPKDNFFLHMLIHLFSGSQIKCRECNISLLMMGESVMPAFGHMMVTFLKINVRFKENIRDNMREIKDI